MEKWIAVLSLGLLVAGCSLDEEDDLPLPVAKTASIGGHGAQKPVNISVICALEPTELSTAIKSGVESASQTMERNDNLKLLVKWCPFNSQADLNSAMEGALTRHDQVVLYCPDYRFSAEDQLSRLAKAGAKIVALGRDIPHAERSVFCGIPDQKLGNRLGYTIAGKLTSKETIGVIWESGEANFLHGLREVSTHFAKLSLRELEVPAVTSQAVKDTIQRHPDIGYWVVFKGTALQEPSDFKSLNPQKVRIYTLGCWPQQLPLLESGLIKPLSLPSYELGYLALCRAIDVAVLRKKTDDTYMIATPLVDRSNVKTYALSLRRWGFTNVASRYLDTVRSNDSVQ